MIPILPKRIKTHKYQKDKGQKIFTSSLHIKTNVWGTKHGCLVWEYLTRYLGSKLFSYIYVWNKTWMFGLGAPNKVLRKKNQPSIAPQYNTVMTKNELKQIIREEIENLMDTNVVDTITMDVPLFLRMLEYAKEDAQTDMDLHNVTERATKLGLDGDVLTMKDYAMIVGGELNEQTSVNKIEPSLAFSIYGLLKRKVGDAFIGEFPTKTSFFHYLNDNLE